VPCTKLKKRADGRFRKVYAGVPFYCLTEKEATDKASAYKCDLAAGLRAEQAVNLGSELRSNGTGTVLRAARAGCSGQLCNSVI